MRTKVILAGVLIVAALLLPRALRPRPDHSSVPSPPLASTPSSAPAMPRTASVPPGPTTNALRAGAGSADDRAHALYVSRRIAELDRLAMENDATSRETILSELQNADKSIRKAALEAAVQLDDRSVVPRLKEVADATVDPDEKAEILEAIEYINLPSLTEFLEAQKTNAATDLTNVAPRRLHPARLPTPP